MNMPNSYQEAKQELDELLNALEGGEVDIDELSQKVQRAGLLLNYCQNMLKSTEKEVNELLKSFVEEEDNPLEEREDEA